MNRVDELVHDITLYLKENEIDELYITKPEKWDDIIIRLTNLCDITSEISYITIEPIENVWDVWWQVSYYIKIEWSTKWYNLILDNQAEKMDIQSIEDLAKAIDSYEREAYNLILTTR